MNHKGRCVTWVGKDGGHKVGHVVAPDGFEVMMYRRQGLALNYLVQHSGSLEIQWVPGKELKPYTGAKGTAYA